MPVGRQRDERVSQLMTERERELAKQTTPAGALSGGSIMHFVARLFPKGPRAAGLRHDSCAGSERLAGTGRDAANLARPPRLTNEIAHDERHMSRRVFAGPEH